MGKSNLSIKKKKKKDAAKPKMGRYGPLADSKKAAPAKKPKLTDAEAAFNAGVEEARKEAVLGRKKWKEEGEAWEAKHSRWSPPRDAVWRHARDMRARQRKNLKLKPKPKPKPKPKSKLKHPGPLKKGEAEA